MFPFFRHFRNTKHCDRCCTQPKHVVCNMTFIKCRVSTDSLIFGVGTDNGEDTRQDLQFIIIDILARTSHLTLDVGEIYKCSSDFRTTRYTNISC